MLFGSLNEPNMTVIRLIVQKGLGSKAIYMYRNQNESTD
jgi:hypothetical protein